MCPYPFLQKYFVQVVMKEDDRHFRITVPVAASNPFYGWVSGLIMGSGRVKEDLLTPAQPDARENFFLSSLGGHANAPVV